MPEDKKGENDKVVMTAEDGQLGDDFISLTFRESDSEDASEEEEEEENEGDDDETDEAEDDDMSI